METAVGPIVRAASASRAPRRALVTRRARWTGRLAHALARAGVQPNTISIAGLVCAGIAGLTLAIAPALTASTSRAALLVGAAAAIQLRLLCNLLDGMLAIEHGLQTKSGAIFNEVPDRIADVVILVGAGQSVRMLHGGSTLGWSAATLALFTAYVRVLAGSLGLTQHFIGPMAKQHRMFTLTIAALVSVVEALLRWPPFGLYFGLVVIVCGSLVTVVRRTERVVDEVNGR
jgi:phosphatidylglycerophosphate synthase